MPSDWLVKKTILIHKETGEIFITEDNSVAYRKTHPKELWDAKKIRDIESQYTTVCYGEQMWANPSRARRIMQTELPKNVGDTVTIREERTGLGKLTMTKANKGYVVRHYWPLDQQDQPRYGTYDWDINSDPAVNF